ncbi:MAG TPA: HAD family hydrolase [Candidatus Rubrimentiphilum sp.]|nr:HAD family hydrolase [Candidatus Rubrimentiphilum sp.]
MDPADRLCSHSYRPQPLIIVRFSALGFDIDHTLGIDNKLERVAFLHLLEEICAQGGHALGTLDQESVAIDKLLAAHRSGAFSIDEAVNRFVAARGVPRSDAWLRRYKEMVLENVDHFFIPQPDASFVLKELDTRRIPCAVLSNGWSPLQQRKAERVSFRGPVLVSDMLGVQKPQAAAFLALARALEREPAAVAFVGDNPIDDIDAAQRAGMPAIWFDAEGERYPGELAAPDAVIHRLAELLAFL